MGQEFVQSLRQTASPDEESLDELRWRRAWAWRRGNPAWLWPEVEPDTWREANRTIAEIVRAVLQLGEPCEIDGEPQALGLAGYVSGMGPMLGHWLENGALAASRPEIADLFACHLDNNRRRMASLLGWADRLLAGLEAIEVNAVLLKGAHTASAYFPEPGARPMSDIDILVSPEDLPSTRALLEAQGFACESEAPCESSWRHRDAARRPVSCQMLDVSDPWTIDLHHSLDLVVSAAAPVARLDQANPFTSARRRVQGALCQPLLLAHLAVHAGGSLHNLNLMRLMEIGLVIRQDEADGTLDWDEFLDVAALTGSLGYCYPALEQAERLLPGLVPVRVLSACSNDAPSRAVTIIKRLDPATAQRVDRHSLMEHFMWTQGLGGWLRQIADDLSPGGAGSLLHMLQIQARRIWIIFRGQLSR